MYLTDFVILSVAKDLAFGASIVEILQSLHFLRTTERGFFNRRPRVN